MGRPGEGRVDGEVEERGGEVLHLKAEEEKGEEEEMEMKTGEGVDMLRSAALRPATRKEAKPPTIISARIFTCNTTKVRYGFIHTRFLISSNFH